MGWYIKNFFTVATAAFCVAYSSQVVYSQPADHGGSVELIVRPEAGKSSSIHETLREGVVPKQDSDSLFAEVESISSVFGSSRSSRKNGGEAVSIPAFRLAVRDSASFRRLRTRWQQHPEVRYAHANVAFRVNSKKRNRLSSSQRDDPVLRADNVLADSLDHLDVVRALDAWAVTSGTTDVRIGVVDTGIFLDHPDLSDQLWINEAEDVNGNGTFDPYPADEGGDLNGVDDDGNGFIDDVIGYDFVDRPSAIPDGEFTGRDPDPSADPKGGFSWHGTAVAGVVSAAPGDPTEGISGVAPDTRLVPLRAFGRDGRGRTDDIAAAIVYGTEIDLDVLNLSFGRDRAVPLIEDAIEYANEQGTVVVASAGNELTDDPHYPSDYPDVLSVVWLGENGELPQFNQSQFGIGVDLGAPGSAVYTADFPSQKVREGETLSREDLYRSPSGSSFSAPQVAGAAALLRSADSSLSPASIRSILTTTAQDIEGANWDHKTGAGLLNVEQALLRPYPARTELMHPNHNQGIQGQSSTPITGTVIDPSFKHYAIYYAEGTTNLDQRSDPWTEIVPPTTQQVLDDTLGVWSAQELSELEEGEYTLRLVTTLKDDRTIEDRRRIRVDSSPPVVDVHYLGVGRVDGDNGIVADIETDDVTRLRLKVQFDDRTDTVLSEHQARRQGINWADERGTGGRAKVQVEATNAADLTTSIDTTLQIPPSQENTGLFRRSITSMPRGRLLSQSVDFDDDGLREVLMNQFVDGGISDTLRSFEWAGSEFVPSDTLAIGPFLPKDVGDTNGDGLQELLLQVQVATLLFEQPNRSSFPTDLIFADTSRISDASADTLNGARLTDLDADGQGEIVGTDQQQWKVLERRHDDFEEIARLENPTELGPDSSLGNRFDFQEAATGDFDGDGRNDLLVGDRDGDLIVYEATGNDQIEPAWSVETDRENAGTRFATGDFSGGGRTDFVTMTTRQEAPAISYYSVWRRAGDDAYERTFRLPIPGPYTDLGSLTTADFDGDDRPEVAIAHPPSLLVLDQAPDGDWRVLYEDPNSSVLSRSLLAADVSSSGRPSVFAGTNDDQLVRYAVDNQALAVAPPRWIRARAGGSSSTVLAWDAPGADSVTVYAGLPEAQLNPVVTLSDSSVTIEGAEDRRYALRAWENGVSSPLSEVRTVRPHSPATVVNVSYPDPSAVQLQFSEPLAAADLRTEQFQFGPKEVSPRRLVRSRNGEGIILHFSPEVAGQSGPLTWSGVADGTGLGVGQTAIDLSFPASNRPTLFIEEATIIDETRVRLTFNAPLDPVAARERDRYTIHPRGRVTDVEVGDDSSATVLLRVDGLVLGASGEEASLTVSEMVGASGGRLSKEGGTVRLTRPAADLSNVFVYPNPYRAKEHGDVTIAGLPSEATVRIYTPGGRLVRTLSIRNNRDGGHPWNLRNRRGERVPSGVYLFRVNAPGQSPVLEKAAVIR